MMTRRNLLTLLIMAVTISAIVTTILLYKKYNVSNESKDDKDNQDNEDVTPSVNLSDIKIKADEEQMQQKGGLGDWGDNQKKFIYYTIAYSLLDTQTEITGKEMTIEDFTTEITDCLTCMVKNFSVKYTYIEVVNKIAPSATWTSFDDFFKNLYTTCECEDKLGELLVRLLKEFWLEESSNICPTTKDKMSECISTISYTGFEGVNIHQIYTQLTECITNFCPELLNA
jgi:hypothetical protein